MEDIICRRLVRTDASSTGSEERTPYALAQGGECFRVQRDLPSRSANPFASFFRVILSPIHDTNDSFSSVRNVFSHFDHVWISGEISNEPFYSFSGFVLFYLLQKVLRCSCGSCTTIQLFGRDFLFSRTNDSREGKGGCLSMEYWELADARLPEGWGRKFDAI